MPALNRRSFLARSAVVALGSQAGCVGSSEPASYRSFGYDSHNRGYSTGVRGPSSPVEPVWTFEDALPAQTPAVVDGTVFAASTREQRSTVVALDAATGAENWEYQVGAPLTTQWSPAVSDGRLFFIDTNGTAHAVDTTDGTQAWRRELPIPQGPLNTPIATNGAFVFGLGTQTLLDFGGLYALETTDGDVRFHISPDTGTDQFHTPTYPAATGDEILYTMFTEPEVIAVSADRGKELWRTPLDGETGYTSVSLTSDRVYLGGPQGQAAFSGDQGAIEWRSPKGIDSVPPTVGDGTAIITVNDDDGFGIRAVDAGGEERWRHLASIHGPPSPRTIAEGVVYYCVNGVFHARDAETGESVFSVGPDPALIWTPVVLDDTVFVSGGEGLVALQTG